MPTNRCRVVLIGAKHCGKSTIGRRLAEHFGVDFIDVDDELCRRFAAASVRELFRRLGETEFRRREAALLREFADRPGDRVLATGGGAVDNPDVAPDLWPRLGLAVWLDVPDEILCARVLAGGVPPFLAGAADPAAELRRMNQHRRDGFRAVARLRLTPPPAGTADDTLAELCRRLNDDWQLRPASPAADDLL